MLLLLLFIANSIFRSLRRRWKHWKKNGEYSNGSNFTLEKIDWNLKFWFLRRGGKRSTSKKKPQEARTNNKPSHKGSTPFKTSGGIQCKHTKKTASNYIFSHKYLYWEKMLKRRLSTWQKQKQESVNLGCDLKLRANKRSNSQHCWAKNVGSCCVCVSSGVQTVATTQNNVGTYGAWWERYIP